MSPAEKIIAECEARGCRLFIGESSTELAYDAPAGALTPRMRDKLADLKADVIQLLYEREERAALQDAPEWADASTWHRGTTHPATLALLSKLAPLGLSIVSVTPGKRRQEAA